MTFPIAIEASDSQFAASLVGVPTVRVIGLTRSQAETLSHKWRQQGIRLRTHDLRIAAICVAHSATLISRNRRDFERVPRLVTEFWQ